MTDAWRVLKVDADQALLEVRRLHLVERTKLLHLLDLCYRQRLIDAHCRFIITASDWMGIGRLESQGADHQVVALPDERASRLIEYQDEMQQFTAFLKALFFRAHLEHHGARYRVLSNSLWRKESRKQGIIEYKATTAETKPRESEYLT